MIHHVMYFVVALTSDKNEERVRNHVRDVSFSKSYERFGERRGRGSRNSLYLSEEARADFRITNT